MTLASLLALAAPQHAGTEAPPPHTVAIPAPEGGPIQADVYGTGPRGVVLLHGGRFDRTSWKPQATVLAASGFHAEGPKELVVLDGSAHAQALFDTPQGSAILQQRFLAD